MNTMVILSNVTKTTAVLLQINIIIMKCMMIIIVMIAKIKIRINNT